MQMQSKYKCKCKANTNANTKTAAPGWQLLLYLEREREGKRERKDECWPKQIQRERCKEGEWRWKPELQKTWKNEKCKLTYKAQIITSTAPEGGRCYSSWREREKERGGMKGNEGEREWMSDGQRLVTGRQWPAEAISDMNMKRERRERCCSRLRERERRKEGEWRWKEEMTTDQRLVSGKYMVAGERGGKRGKMKVEKRRWLMTKSWSLAGSGQQKPYQIWTWRGGELLTKSWSYLHCSVSCSQVYPRCRGGMKFFIALSMFLMKV